MKKTRDLAIIAAIYLLAFVVGFLACMSLDNIMLKLFVFDLVATVVTFIFSVIFKNSSVYDAYWSLTPMVMSVWLFAKLKAFSVMQILFLIAFNIWGFRLTANWVTVFTDFSYEDWRYRKYRDESPKFFWPFVNFFGIHLMPTLVVFAGMLPMFVIAERDIHFFSVFGILLMLLGVFFEHSADTSMHRFLSEAKEKTVCRLGLWNYSRHPNYLGEITFWVGVYCAMLPVALDYWYYGVGCLSVAVLINVVSIPLMEKRQLSRRPEYAEYRLETSRLLIMPPKPLY